MFFESCGKSEYKYNKNNDSFVAKRFTACAEKGDVKNIQKFLEKGVDINVTNEDGYDALMEATKNNDIYTVSYLLSKGASPINGLDEWNALFMAAHLGYTRIVNKFIQNGVDVNFKSAEHGYSPLFLAAIAGNYEIALLLLKSGADPNVALHEGITPLMALGISGDMKMLRILMDHKADIWAYDKDEENLYKIAKSSSNTRITELIESMQKPLIKHVTDNNMQEMISYLMIQGMDVNVKDSEGKTALMYASETGNFEMVKLLLNMNADVNMKDSTGYNALMEAIEALNINIVALLIDKGVNVNEYSTRIYPTALHLAVTTGRYDIVEMLVYAGADVNSKDKNGSTPLMFAVEYGYKDISHLLIDNGAQPSITNNQGESAFEIAKIMHNTDCLK